MKKIFILLTLLAEVAIAQVTTEPAIVKTEDQPQTQNRTQNQIQSQISAKANEESSSPVSNGSVSTANTVVVSVQAPVQKAEEEKKFNFFGDFRYRHQSEKQGPKDQRTVQRIQARFGITNQLHEDLKVTLRMMTGSSANSGNQTLGDDKAPGMPRRNFGLDQAFFDYNPAKSWNLYGGKMPQVFTFVGKNQMILDNDIAPEGLGGKFVQPFEEDFELFIQGGMFWIRENYDSQFGEDLTDNFLNAGQVGLQWKPQDWSVLFGVGSFAYTDFKDNPPANITTGSTGNGNTLDINGNYPTNFDIEEYFVEIKKKLGAVDMALFFEMLTNKDASDLNKAQAVGIQIKYSAWSLSFTQKEVQKDSVVGVFTDSDFGAGTTSVKGFVANLGYKISKKVQIQYALYKNETAIDLVPVDYDRSHLDLLMNF